MGKICVCGVITCRAGLSWHYSQRHLPWLVALLVSVDLFSVPCFASGRQMINPSSSSTFLRFSMSQAHIGPGLQHLYVNIKFDALRSWFRLLQNQSEVNNDICATDEEGTENRPLVEGKQQRRNWVTSCGLPPTFLLPVLCLVACFCVVPSAQLSYG